GLIANPNCSTMQMVVALAPIHRAAGIERLVVATYQSVSGTGRAAIEELENQAHASLHGVPMPEPEVYPEPIVFNVIGAAGSFADGDDHTDEERKMMFETRKILEDESIGVAITCVRVPVRIGHSEAVNIQTRVPLRDDALRAVHTALHRPAGPARDPGAGAGERPVCAERRQPPGLARDRRHRRRHAPAASRAVCRAVA